MNHTTNYQLSQWEAGDKVQRVDFNADNAKIDAAIKAVDTLTGGKADASTVTALSQTVSGHTTTLGKKGNCQIYYTTYAGDGQSGESGPKRLNFPGKPLAVFVTNATSNSFLALIYGGYGAIVGSNNYSSHITWGSRYVQWYSSNAQLQFNMEGVTYSAVALLAMD